MNIKFFKSNLDADHFETEFVKKDGSLRKMKFKLQPPKEVIQQMKTKTSNKKPAKLPEYLLRVWDIQKSDFRIINLKTVKYIKAFDNKNKLINKT